MGKFNDNYNSLIKSLSEILIEQEFKRESKKRTNYFNREKIRWGFGYGAASYKSKLAHR